jgi:hypothetical protein
LLQLTLLQYFSPYEGYFRFGSNQSSELQTLIVDWETLSQSVRHWGEQAANPALHRFPPVQQRDSTSRVQN